MTNENYYVLSPTPFTFLFLVAFVCIYGLCYDVCYYICGIKTAVVKQTIKISICSWLLVCGGCMMASTEEGTDTDGAMPAVVEVDVTDPAKAIPVTEDSFVCLKKMRPVRGFFVSNLLDNLDDTVTAAMSPHGATYPPGSVVQLIPTEVMIKHYKGWNTKTSDWEFFELDVSEEGSKIKVRGTTQVVNKFGGNCFECHQKAEPQWDFICEEDHGCDSLPIPDLVIRWMQRNDPRCE